jgi:hypothetical protein
MSDNLLNTRSFLEGPAGSGKTTYAVEHLYQLLAQDVPANNILVLVPQRILGLPYRLAMQDQLRQFQGDVAMVTLSGLARRNVERFWPLIAEQAGFNPRHEPIFLTIETAQYYMMRFTRPAIEEGLFDAISLAPPRIAAQLLDNMAKAAIADFPYAEVAERLMSAWGDRHSSRLQIYEASHNIGEAYRAYCREHNLLDYALQLEVFMHHLLPQEVFQRYFASRFQHLIADNIEEMGPLAHQFIAAWWEHWQSALLVYDSDAGFRTFLGADPENAIGLRDRCDQTLVMDQPLINDEPLIALELEVQRALNPVFAATPPPERNPMESVRYQYNTYYPQMIDWVAQNVIDLVESGVSPREIVIMAPFLSDSLRFTLQHQLTQAGVPTVSHRPSRALRDEPAARALLTLLQLGNPNWSLLAPPRSDVADTFSQVIDGLDPVRAKLLADIVYKPQHGGSLSSFEQIKGDVRDRITYQVGERYDQLRLWLLAATEEMGEVGWPPDYYLSRLFGEVLSQPGFGFHTHLDSGRIAAQLIESARKFRQVLYPYEDEAPDWHAVGEEYLQLVKEDVLAALYTGSWRDESLDAVLLAPAFTFLMRNRFVDYQFWLDVGSESWWERIDQPLTHPYVLMQHYPGHLPWTETDESEKQQERLHRITVGLIRRCRKAVYLGISDLGEQGYEQRGPMLYLFQQIMQRYTEGGDHGS